MREQQYTATRSGTRPPIDQLGEWTPHESLTPERFHGYTLWRREVEVADTPPPIAPAKRDATPSRLGEHHAALQPVGLLVSLFSNALTQLEQGEARLGLRRDGVERGYVEDEEDARHRERWLAALRGAIASGDAVEADYLAHRAPQDHEPEGAAFARYLDAIRYALSGAPLGEASLFDLVPATGRAANKSSADDPRLVLGLAVLARIAMSRSESQAQDARRAALSAEERAEARERKRGKSERSAAMSAPTRQIVAHGYAAWAAACSDIDARLSEISNRPALTQSDKGDQIAPLLVARRALVEPPEPIAWAIITAHLAGVPLGIELEPEIIDAAEVEEQLAHRLGFPDARELNRREEIAQLVSNELRVRAWKGSAATAERRNALTKRISERLRWLLDAEDALTAYRLEEVAAAWQSGDDERAEMLLDYADGWLGISAQLDALGARLAPERGRGWITALLDSVPLAASFAEARRIAKTGESVPERGSDEEREPTAAELAEIEAERY
jgi:hypothetical protein